MEQPILVLQDRIIYLTGQIVLLGKEEGMEIAKKTAISGWNREIKELKKAQEILSAVF
jgi:hypothetical protein